MRQCVPLLQTPLCRNRLIAPRKGNRLEGKEGNLLWVIQGEANNRAYLIIIDSVDQGSDQYNLYACFVEVINRSQLHIEEVPHLTMAIRIVADPIKLEIYIPQSGFRCLAAELFALCELNPI